MRKYICKVPEGKKGVWGVVKFKVSKEDSKLEALRAAIGSSAMGRGVTESGNYTGLFKDGSMVMSDTPDEMNDFSYFVSVAHGSIFIGGLGLGMILEALYQKQIRTHRINIIHVVEISQNVIDLTGNHYKEKWSSLNDCHLNIINDNVFMWNPRGIKFDCVWHDIWDNICSDNLPEMKKLHRRFGHWLKPNGIQQSWARAYCELAKQRWGE